jgi:hypothetical protein
VDVIEAGSLLVRDDAGRLVATVFLQGAAPVRIVSREVSPRLGQRVSAQCLELPLDSALEALTIIVPAGPEGSAVSFEVEALRDAGTVRWTDATGRHCVITGAAQGAPLPGAPAVQAGLTWRIESAAAAAGDAEGTLLAALPAPPPQPPADVQAITHLPEESGRMIVVTYTGGRWQQLGVDTPRRG